MTQATIHNLASIDEGADIASGVTIGPYAVIENGVQIGEGTVVGPHAVIRPGALIGSNCLIGIGAVISEDPQDITFDPSVTSGAIIEDGAKVREYATIHRSCDEGGNTRVGKNAFIMAYCHLAHDAAVEEDVIIANGVQLGGHVHLDKACFIGGGTVVHQFCRVGEGAIVSGGIAINKDIPPFMIGTNIPIRVYGINRIGLRRRGHTREAIKALDDSYRMYFRSEMSRNDALAAIEAKYPNYWEVEKFLDFCRNPSKKGIGRAPTIDETTH